MRALKTKHILILILILASFLRIYNLSTVPLGLFTDELGSGYDAYSLIHTARDRHGDFLPIHFQAFGDFPPPVLTYSNIPFIWMFGLSPFSTRISSALYGIGAVLVIFFLARRLYESKPALALASMFLLAVSPWHVQFSRTAVLNIGLVFFFLLSFLFLLLSLKKQKYLYFAAVSLGITLYTYAVAKLFVPLFLLAFVVIYYKKFNWRLNLRAIVLAFVILSLIALPMYYNSFFGGGKARFNQVSLFNEYGDEPFPTMVKETALSFTKNYLSYFTPSFLFFKGDSNLRHSPAGFGQLLIFEIPLLIIGFFILIKRRTTSDKILLAYLVLFPVAASLTVDPGHAVRTLIGAPVFALISAIGVHAIFTLRIKKYIRVGLIITIALLALINVSFFYNHYFSQYPKDAASSFYFGKGEAFLFATDLYNKNGTYNKVVVKSGDEIYALFYGKVDPKTYQESEFKETIFSDCFIRECCKPEFNNLCVVGYDELTDFNLTEFYAIYHPNGKKYYRVVG